MVADLTPKWPDYEGEEHQEKGLLPKDPLGERFLSYFNHPWHFIHAPIPHAQDHPAWKTETRYPLQPRNLWSMYQNPDVLLGLRFGQKTNYFLSDIDAGSVYHPDNSLERFKAVQAVLESIGLVRPVIIQSSPSGGLHIYYFLKEKLNTFSLASTATQALRQAGIRLLDGQLELFPNAKPYGKDKPTKFKAHRLPLQSGSYLLDRSSYQPYSNDLEEFLDAADWSAEGQDYETLHEAIVFTKNQQPTLFSRSQNSKATQEWEHHLLERFKEGWTDFHQTNALLGDMACHGHVFRRLQGEALVDYIVATAEAAPGYHQFCRHQHEIQQRATHWARCCENYYSPYPSIPNRLGTYREILGNHTAANNVVSFSPNQQRHERTLARVSSVVTTLKESGKFPDAASDRTRAIITTSKEQYGVGVSQTTLHKPEYLCLWHPVHELLRSETGVDAPAVPLSAPEPPEKYPQLPDPWGEDEASQTPVQQGFSSEPTAIYTLPPYMKVVNLCQPQADEVENPETPFSSEAAVSQEQEINFTDSNFYYDEEINLQAANSDPQSNSSQQFIHKQNKYLEKCGAALTNDKLTLSIPETLTKPTVLPDAPGVDSWSDSQTASSLKTQRADVSPPVIQVSVPGSVQFSVPGDSTGPPPSTKHCRTVATYFSPPEVDPPNELEAVTGNAVDAVTPEQYRIATKLRLQAIAFAKERVRMYCMAYNVHFTPARRIDVEQLAVRILLKKTGSPLLTAEACEWYANNRNRLERDGLAQLGIVLFPDLFG